MFTLGFKFPAAAGASIGLMLGEVLLVIHPAFIAQKALMKQVGTGG